LKKKKTHSKENTVTGAFDWKKQKGRGQSETRNAGQNPQ